MANCELSGYLIFVIQEALLMDQRLRRLHNRLAIMNSQPLTEWTNERLHTQTILSDWSRCWAFLAAALSGVHRRWKTILMVDQLEYNESADRNSFHVDGIGLGRSERAYCVLFRVARPTSSDVRWRLFISTPLSK